MISIIIPTLNEEKIIGSILQALKAKLTLPHELIVTDGKSSDKTVEIARKYADKVVEYTGTARQTIAQGRNDGAKHATGDYFVFMDADVTIPEPDIFFTRALRNFQNNPKLVAQGAWIRVLPEFETWADRFNFGMIDVGNYVMNNLLRMSVAQGEFQMMRREAFHKVRGYREDLAVSEDLDMFKRLSKLGTTHLDPKMVIYHTGRRAHKIGWWKLQGIWARNTIMYSLRGKPHSTEWEVIR